MVVHRYLRHAVDREGWMGYFFPNSSPRDASMSETKRISTTQLARRHGLDGKELFSRFVELGLIFKEGDEWVLTRSGREVGGEYQESEKFGRYITWPAEIDPEGLARREMLSATSVGESLGIPARRINQILSEHGWIRKHLKGWLVTSLGQRVGGRQRENNKSGIPYVVWPVSVLDDETLKTTIKDLKGESVKGIADEAPSASKASGFRDKFKPKMRTADGHYVRSRAEMLIDNWLYTAEVVHAYERRLPVEEEAYCDFYLSSGRVYIEFWGMESDPAYQKRQQEKRAIYKKYDLNLIELGDQDIANIDDVMPRLLLKHGITTY